MSEDKAQVLHQINEIKSHLVDKQTFFPYNYKATYVWSIITIILTFIAVPLYTYSLYWGSVGVIIIIAIGFILEHIMTQKVNRSYDISEYTLRQQFITQHFLMLSIFGVVLSMVLASEQLYVAIFLLWLFLCSVGYAAVGFVLNIKCFSQIAHFNIMVSTLLLGIGYWNQALESKEIFLILVQSFVILGLAVMPSVVAWQQIKEEK